MSTKPHHLTLRAEARRVAALQEEGRITTDELQADAACRDHDHELFFPTGDADPRTDKARAVCDTCPIRLLCLAYATQGRAIAPEGVWGGRTPTERRYIIEHARAARAEARRTA